MTSDQNFQITFKATFVQIVDSTSHVAGIINVTMGSEIRGRGRWGSVNDGNGPILYDAAYCWDC